MNIPPPDPPPLPPNPSGSAFTDGEFHLILNAALSSDMPPTERQIAAVVEWCQQARIKARTLEAILDGRFRVEHYGGGNTPFWIGQFELWRKP